MKKHLQTGFAHLGLLLLVIVVAVIGAVGYKVINDTNKAADTASNSTVPASSVSKIKNNSDLDKVKATLNQTDLDGDLNPSSLDHDVKSLL